MDECLTRVRERGERKELGECAAAEAEGEQGVASHSLRRPFFNYLDKMINAIYHWLDNDIKKIVNIHTPCSPPSRALHIL